MSHKVWLPVILVFIVVLIFAGLRLSSVQVATDGAAQNAVNADPNLAHSLLKHLLGPKNDDQ